MPRRASARTANSNLPSQDLSSTSNQPPAQPFSAELTALRTNWKWAAFSQFFYTFSQLFNMEDVTLQNIEDDLVQGNSIVLPRIMLKLLVILSNDRKLNLDNWQTALRRQYNRRDPLANPIGPEPPKTSTNSRYTSVIEEDEEENLDVANHYKPEGSEESPHETGLRASTSRIQSSSPSRAQTPASQTIGTPHVNGEEEKLLPTKKALKSQSLGPTTTAEFPELSETKDWNSLSMLEKLDSMHLLTEWLFHNPARVRVLMKSDDEAAEWATDRLWVQRIPPRPSRPAKSSNKRKRGATEEVKPKNAKKAKSAHKTTTTARSKGKEKAKVNGKAKEEPSTPGRRGRAAKEKANVLLDAQAKQLAELNRQAAATAKSNGRASRSSSNKQPPPAPTPSRLTRNSSSSSRPLGTRISARLRGAQEDDDEWQAIPAEWLDKKDEDEDDGDEDEDKTGLDSSALSDLTELSDADNEDDVEEEEEREEETEEDDDDEGAAEEVNEPKVEEPEEPALPEGFVEWETICVTLYEWEHIAERWQNATHYAEKALYKVLTKHIVPVIVEELRAIENKRRMEEAIVHRKRSSRIAIKESEKEEARLAAQRKAEEEEKMGRARRAEARQKKEESERMKRELAREQRRKEREAQAEAQEREESTPVDVADTMEGKSEPQAKKNKTTASVNGLSSGTRTPAGDDWELDCEICHRRGINVDDGVPLMSCGKCFKWQHIPCHDKADRKAGLPRRNWEDVEFFCRQCRSKMFTPAPSWNSTVNAYSTHNSRGQIPQNIHLNPPLPPNRHPSLLTSHSNVSAYPQSSYQLPTNYSDMRSSVGYVNGYDRMATSDVRSSPQSNPQQHAKPIAFQHYQPPQQGYSASQSPPQYNVNLGTQVQPYGQQMPPTTFHHAMTNGQSTPNRLAPNEGWIQHDFSRPYTNYNNSAERVSAAPLPQHYRSPQQQHQQWPPQPTQLPTSTNTPYSPYPPSS
ncbi:hypothetical protein VNI00_005180 [Paramarasmius palmivorus]|uniref:Zinc finger PHD-type domain-containing protein n=1 Tax=Paramarasmius palmivorus TaxID=297713 RepID=A0AAW0DEM1_9AGAR